MTSRFAIAKETAVFHLEEIIITLYQGQRKHMRRALWNVVSRFRPGAHEGQMVIYLTGARRGAFIDFPAGTKGDAIDTVAYGLVGEVTHQSRMDAVEWIEDRYGLKNMSPEKKRTMEAEGKARRVLVEAEEVTRRESNLTRARKMFFGAREGIRGTLAETYLASRGIDLDQVDQLVENTFRFSPGFEYWLDAPVDGEGKKTGKGSTWPAMISAMISDKGKIGACHITYLARDGQAKAPVDKAKLMWPETAGMMIRITQGPSGLSLEAAAEAGQSSILGVTEGIEDALSVAIADPLLRMWAAGSLPGLLYVPDSPAVSGYLIFKDNDWGKKQAEALFDKCVNRIRGFGKPVEVISMPAEWGKDVNDAIRREG